MYGGVSLAVYMNGVAREYFDLVRGRGVWGIFKRLADVDAVVDVISGASAGGLNGLFLAYAICGHREFGTMVDLWRNRAGIEALLADPATPGLHSLLKSEYMENELKNAFETMPPVAAGRADELAVSESPDLDCFMAATNFYGQRVTVGDPDRQPDPDAHPSLDGALQASPGSQGAVRRARGAGRRGAQRRRGQGARDAAPVRARQGGARDVGVSGGIPAHGACRRRSARALRHR